MRYFVIGGLVNKGSELPTEKSFENICITIGKTLWELDHSIIVCSPFMDSADYWVLEGFASNSPTEKRAIEFHFIDNKLIRSEIDKLERKYSHLHFIKIPHPPPTNNESSYNYSWLFCQLQALESCHTVIALGGKLEGSANLLLQLAESKRKPILPLTFLGGAAEKSFQRRRYELEDIYGMEYSYLQNETSIVSAIKLGESQTSKKVKGENKDSIPVNYFISYPRTRPSEADFIETLLRRRNLQVFRDESDFGAGHAIPKEIEEAVYKANVFIAVWCTEYACSPWCFDEMELALDRHDAGKLDLWIICTDETRIIPKRARNLNYKTVRTREEIEGYILKLLEN